MVTKGKKIKSEEELELELRMKMKKTSEEILRLVTFHESTEARKKGYRITIYRMYNFYIIRKMWDIAHNSLANFYGNGECGIGVTKNAYDKIVNGEKYSRFESNEKIKDFFVKSGMDTELFEGKKMFSILENLMKMDKTYNMQEHVIKMSEMLIGMNEYAEFIEIDCSKEEYINKQLIEYRKNFRNIIAIHLKNYYETVIKEYEDKNWVEDNLNLVKKDTDLTKLVYYSKFGKEYEDMEKLIDQLCKAIKKIQIEDMVNMKSNSFNKYKEALQNSLEEMYEVENYKKVKEKLKKK